MVDWSRVAEALRRDADDARLGWRYDQDAALRWLAKKLPAKPGVLIADEVGLGKTRIAIAVMQAVAEAGGKVAVAVPPTLMFQWEAEYAALLRARTGERDQPDSRQLRVFLDAFPEAADDRTYPLNSQRPFLLLSHRFGLAGRIGGKVGAYAWALPYIVRSFIDHGPGNWWSAKGLDRDDWRLQRQVTAARWLAAHAKSLRPCMKELPPLNDSTGSDFSADADDDKPKPARLLRALLGRLFGRFDLVVIDEAHKSRETLDDPARSRRRLPLLLDEILRHAAGSRRLGLTATPIQMSEEDWGSTLRRIGIVDDDLRTRMEKIKRFEGERERLRSGPASDADVKALCGAARTFHSALADIMIRRRWSEHPEIQRAQKVFDHDDAHPHRRWDTPPAVVPWQCLSTDWKRDLLATEGASLAAAGSSLSLVERLRASRLAQAMDGLGGPDLDDGTVDEEATAKALSGDPGTRVAYWKGVSRRLRPDEDPIETMRHPRLLAAVSWIERITEVGGKVLVFATYRKPMEALTGILNLRRYVRDLVEERPATKPDLLSRLDDRRADELLRATIKAMPELGELPDLAKRVERCRQLQETRRRELRSALQRLPPTDANEEMSALLRVVLLEPWLSNPEPGHLSTLARRFTLTLARGDVDAEQASADARQALQQAMQEQASSPRSDFARGLDGNVKPATRRILQALFNEDACRPRVLVAQSRVASEGLNLHTACRHVLFLHLDWNPALIEQQIGRVDRIESLWAKQFAEAQPDANLPRIEISAVVLEGTSDGEKRDRIMERRKLLDAHLFGGILPGTVVTSLKPEWRERLRALAPDFSPNR